MEIKELKQIVDLMKRSDISEFEIEEEGLKLRIKRGNDENTTTVVTGTPAPFPMHAAPVVAAPAAAPAAAPEQAEAAPIGKVVKSPMVGTFYRASSPENAPFVDIGSDINDDSVVCIIEAMKVMNEIQAEISGKIVKVLVENGDSVEYGQPLFEVK